MKSLVATIAALAFCWVPTVSPTVAEAAPQGGMFPPACRQQQTSGAIVGAVIGGLLGGRVAGRDNRREGAIIGGLLGAAAGAAVGRNLSSCEQALQQQALQRVWASGKPVQFQAPDTNRYVMATPVSAPTEVGGRQYQAMSAYVTDDPQSLPPPGAEGVFCFNDDGDLVRT